MLLVLGFCTLIAVAIVVAAVWRADTLGLSAVRMILRLRFPDVNQLSTAELAGWLADRGRPAPLLLDVRTEAEYAVSHLPGARRVDPSSTAEEVTGPLEKGRSLVLYCAAGYRSSTLAQRLMRAGFTEVYNLNGSIFAWANEDRPLERDGKPASEVHPCDRIGRPAWAGWPSGTGPMSHRSSPDDGRWQRSGGPCTPALRLRMRGPWRLISPTRQDAAKGSSSALRP